MNNTCKIKIKINANEVDYNRDYTLCSLLRDFQEAVDVHALATRLDGDTMLKEYGAIWILTHIRVDVKEQAKWHDEIEVETYPLRPGILRMEREGVFTKNGKVFACLSSEWCLLDKASGRPRRPEQTGVSPDAEYGSEMVTDGYGKYNPSYSESEFVFSHTVRISDLDINGHMNNVAYTRLAVDAFSSAELSVKPKSFEITFKAQCFEGEEIRVYRKEENGKYFVGGIKSDGAKIFDTMFTF